jgi:hypothetical protein
MISSCSRTALLTDPVMPVQSQGEAASVRNSLSSYGPPYLSLPPRRTWHCLPDEKADADLRLLESLLFPSIDVLPSLKKGPKERPQSKTFEEPFRRRFGYYSDVRTTLPNRS